MPKVKKNKGGGGEKSEPVALADQILEANTVRARGRAKSRDSRAEAEDTYVDERLSRKILQQARIQQEELQTEYGLAPEKKKSPVTTLGNASRLQVRFYVDDLKLSHVQSQQTPLTVQGLLFGDLLRIKIMTKLHWEIFFYLLNKILVYGGKKRCILNMLDRVNLRQMVEPIKKQFLYDPIVTF